MNSALPADGSRAKRGEFGDWIRMKRGFRTVAQVAEAAGRGPSWYERIESGARRYLCVTDIRLLAKALEVEPNEVLREAQRAGY